MTNLFDDLPRQADEELFTELLWRKGVRIERIVSTGQSTPADKPYCDPNVPSSVEVYYLVDDVLAAVADYAAQGCQVLVAPFDITIGKCAVIRDPFGIRLCILDLTKGARPLNLAGSTR